MHDHTVRPLRSNSSIWLFFWAFLGSAGADCSPKHAKDGGGLILSAAYKQSVEREMCNHTFQYNVLLGEWKLQYKHE